MDFLNLYKNCHLCPRSCGIDRTAGHVGARKGFCREGSRPRISYIGTHHGEEPPISGINGSGTIFFTGCSLQCSYCQNYQISRGDLGKTMKTQDILANIIGLIRKTRAHNLNFVTPDHFFPHVFLLVSSLRERGFNLPIVLNLSGYQSKSLLKMAGEYADVYLADYKYADADLAQQLSKCKDYPQKALEAIFEMIKQKGFLSVKNIEDPAIAHEGVLVRHLILPGFIENSRQALTSLFLEFGRQLPLSLMSQYWPVCDHDQQHLNRFLTKDEFYQVYDHALELGFENLFVQFPEEGRISGLSSSRFLPDFTASEPFGLKGR